MFIDLTKVFNLISRFCLFLLLPKIGCPPKLLSLIHSFHTSMQGTVVFNSSCLEPLNIRIIKQDCVPAPTLFGISSLLLQHAFGNTSPSILLHSCSDGHLFNLSHLKVETKTLFANDAAIIAHSPTDLQTLMNHLSSACDKDEFGVTISLEKQQVFTQNAVEHPVICIGDQTLDIADNFAYLGSTISDKLS